MKGVSEKLKAAMEDIKSIMREYDILGNVFLADGLGSGEFYLGVDTSSWSTFRFLKKKGEIKGAHLKAYMKSNREGTERTVNALYNIHGTQTNTWIMYDKLLKDIEKDLEIIKEEGKIISHEEYLKKKDKN